MTTKLYTVDIDGVEHEVNTTCAVADLTPEREYPSKEQFVRAMKGLQSVSVECEVTLPDDVAADLRKCHATWDAIRAAMFKLRKSCRNCRWLKLERDGKNHIRKKYTHYYCKCTRKEDTHLLWYNAFTCEHFRRKCKSKP